MKDNIFDIKKPVIIKDMLTEIIRNGARELLASAIEPTSQSQKTLIKKKNNKNDGLPQQNILSIFLFSFFIEFFRCLSSFVAVKYIVINLTYR